MFRDGDTPKALVDSKQYKVERVSNTDSKDYGWMSGAEAKELLKGFHYEEMVLGDGMWWSNSVKYGYTVTER